MGVDRKRKGYAHVLDDEVADAMERVAKSRKKSRTKLKVVS